MKISINDMNKDVLESFLDCMIKVINLVLRFGLELLKN